MRGSSPLAVLLAGYVPLSAQPLPPVIYTRPTYVPMFPLSRNPQPPVNAWGVKLTDVIPDPAIRYGKLRNGMKYAIMRNATPKGTAAVRLLFGFGSIAEAENERGLAHFIEHMAFSGSTHVPEGDMVKILERQGLAFGADSNAFTDYDNTKYVLDLPQTDTQHVDTALFLFREIASELKCDPAAVNRQRAVILSEERARDNPQLHEMLHRLQFEFPQTPYPNRFPIGLDPVLKSASPDALRDLYHRYYRPENATLVFVGDVDPSEIEAKIVKSFSDWNGVGSAGRRLPRGKVDFRRPVSFSNFADPSAAPTVTYTLTRPWKHPDDTIAERRHALVLGLAEQMFDRRLERLTNGAQSPLIGGKMMSGEQREAALASTVVLVAKDGAWKDALSAAEQEIRRALQYGFTESEVRTASTNMMGELHDRFAASDTRTNQAIAENILSTVADRDLATSPKMMMPTMAILLKGITLNEVNAGFRELWTGSAPLIHVSSKEPIPEQRIAAAYDGSRALAVSAPAETVAKAFAYDDFGKAGTVVEDKTIVDLGVRTVRFQNNVTLNIKKTDFEANRVRFMVRMGDGELGLPKDKPGLGPMISATSIDGALGKDSLEDLKELLAGKVITPGAAVSDDAFVAAGITVPANLALQMKVSAAYLTDPGFRPEAANKWAAVIPLLEKQVDAQPEGVATLRLPIILASGDQRFGMPQQGLLAMRNFDEAKAVLKPVIASAPIEITLVGSVDEDAAIAAVAATFGALPTRQLRQPVPDEARHVVFRSDPSPIVLKHEGPEDKAVVESIWPTTDDSDFREVMAMGLLKDVLDVMLTESVREKLGDTYGANVQSQMSHSFKGFGYLSAAAVVAPDKADEVQEAIARAAAQLREQPVSADMLARARNPELEGIDKSSRDNGFWVAALARTQSEPALLDRIRQRKGMLLAITPADLQKLAQKYLTPDRVQQVRILSTKLPVTTASK